MRYGYDKCFASSRSVLDMLSRSVEVVQQTAVVVVVGHNGRKDELPALPLLLVSHLVVVGLYRHEFVHQLCHLLDVVLLVKDAVVKNGKDLLPPRLLDIVLDNIHQSEDNQKQFISLMKDKVINMCKKYPIYTEAF